MVAMCMRVHVRFQCLDIQICVCRCMHDLVSTKSRDEEGEEGGRLGGKERTCQARSQSSGIEARVVGGEMGVVGGTGH